MSQDSVDIPARSTAVFRVSVNIEDCHLDRDFDVVMTQASTDKHPNLFGFFVYYP